MTIERDILQMQKRRYNSWRKELEEGIGSGISIRKKREDYFLVERRSGKIW